MQRDPRAYLSDILEAAAAIQEATSSTDEALKLISQRDPQLFAVIPEGRQIIDFRNLLTHEYLNVSVQVVWGAIQTDLPVLIDHCTQLFSQLDGGDT